MRVLYVIHDYLPRHAAGAEIYLARLAADMRARGHEVAVFCTELDPGRPDYDLRRRTHDGVPVYEVNHLRRFPDARSTWLDERMEARFTEVLDAVAPDAVHLHHLLYHSLRYPALARRRGLPVLFTLHDYFLICPSLRGGQLYAAWNERCTRASAERCAACLATERVVTPIAALLLRDLLGRLGPLPSRVLARVGRRARRLWPRGVERLSAPVRGGGPGPRLSRRTFHARQVAAAAAIRRTDLFLAPSRHLRRRLIRGGVPARKILHRPYGFPLDSPRPAIPRPHEPGRLSVLFLGTLARHKGPDVLVRAAVRVRDPGLRVVLRGSAVVDPAYVAELRELAAGDPRIRLAGTCPLDEVPHELARADLLVVPSLWEENLPLVVGEALGAGVPVAASDLGGLREWLGAGRYGPLFPAGSDEALADILQTLLRRPRKLAEIAGALPRPRSIARDSADQSSILRRLIERHRSC